MFLSLEEIKLKEVFFSEKIRENSVKVKHISYNSIFFNKSFSIAIIFFFYFVEFMEIPESLIK
jgi:hypothetical protein